MVLIRNTTFIFTPLTLHNLLRLVLINCSSSLHGTAINLNEINFLSGSFESFPSVPCLRVAYLPGLRPNWFLYRDRGAKRLDVLDGIGVGACVGPRLYLTLRRDEELEILRFLDLPLIVLLRTERTAP